MEMLALSQMVARFLLALALGGLIGLEREVIGKEAGVKTSMLVVSGACLFTMAALTLPHVVALSPAHLADVLANNSGFFMLVGNIVVGIGFIGAGIIIKNHEHVHGLTTAALVWMSGAVGILIGIGLMKFAFIVAVVVSGLLYLLRKTGISEHMHAYAHE
jgi:putative Mg2+ transporter-C (MgtC) family protein